MRLAANRNHLLPIDGTLLPSSDVWQREDSQFWRYRIRVGKRVVERGSTRCTNEVAARVFVGERIKALAVATDQGLTPVTLQDAVGRFLALKVEPDQQKSKHSKRTILSMLGIIGEYFEQPSVLGTGALVAQITTPLVSAFKAWLVKPVEQADGATKPTRKPSSANRLLSLLHSVLTLAKDEMHGLAEVPTVKLFEEGATPYAVVDFHEEERLIAAANPELRDLVIVCADTSLRRCEALRLTWPMVVWSTKEATRRSYIEVPPHIRKWKKGEALRIPLSDRALAIFTRRYAAAPDQRGNVFAYSVDDGQIVGAKRAGAKPRGGHKRTSPVPGTKVYGTYRAKVKKGGYYVQITTGDMEKPEHLGWAATLEDARALRIDAEYRYWGAPNTQVGFAQAWKKARRDAGITKRVRFHDLRHTAATRLLDAGVHPKHVQRILGHADIETTMRYLHTAEGYEDQAITMVEAARHAALGHPAPAVVAAAPVAAPATPDDRELFVIEGLEATG